MTSTSTKTVRIPDTDGRLHDFRITWDGTLREPGWLVVGDDIEQFVLWGSLGFPTATSIVVKAYQLQDASEETKP
jgi:hypothetical protein